MRSAATTREVLWQIACGLGTAPREDADVSWLWRQIADRVVENRMQQVATVLLVDDAGQAGPDLMTQFARLARLDPSPSARWTIVLAAEPAQAARWNETLRNLVDLRIELGTWTAEDTIGYVQTALVEAGRMEPLFDDDALRALHELSRRRAAASGAAGRLRAAGRRGGEAGDDRRGDRRSGVRRDCLAGGGGGVLSALAAQWHVSSRTIYCGVQLARAGLSLSRAGSRLASRALRDRCGRARESSSLDD